MDRETAQPEHELATTAAAPTAAVAPAAPTLSGLAAGLGNAAFGALIAGTARPGVARACTCGGSDADCRCGAHAHEEHDEEGARRVLRAAAPAVARDPVAAPAAPNQSTDPNRSIDPSETDPNQSSVQPQPQPAPQVSGPPGQGAAPGEIGPPAPNHSPMPPAGSSEGPAVTPAGGGGALASQPLLPPGAIVLGEADPQITCKTSTMPLNFDVSEALGAAGPVGEHAPPPVLHMPPVPPPGLSPFRALDPSLPPPARGNRAESDMSTLFGLSMAINNANARGTQIPGVAAVTNEDLARLQAELTKAETHSKKATEAQTSLKRDTAAIRSMPAVRAAATNYQKEYRSFEKAVRDTKPKVHGMKSAAAAVASVQAAAGAKAKKDEADRKQAEVDKVKKLADTALNAGVKAVEGFKSGGWMGAAAGAASVVNDAAKEAVAPEIKSLASSMIVKLLKPELAETELEILKARGRAAALTDEAEARAMEAKLEDLNRASAELDNAQKDIEAAGKALLEAEGGFGSALKAAGLTGAIKAIRMRREMRELHGVGMQAVNKHQDALVTNETIISESITLYTSVINLACNAQQAVDVKVTMGTAAANLGATKQFRGYCRREQGACASDRTRLAEWVAAYDVLADDLTAALSELPK